MKPSRRRLLFVLFGMVALGGATALVLMALSDGIDYYYTPSQVREQALDQNRRMRLGGLVVEGSVAREGETLRFEVSDGAASVPIRYVGVLPDLFRENQGIIAEGKMGADGVFAAASILAKHDENYVPRELVKTLQQQDHWFDDKAAQAKGRTP